MKGRQESRSSATDDGMWWCDVGLMCAGEEEGEWMGWQWVGEQDLPCQLLITLIGVIS